MTSRSERRAHRARLIKKRRYYVVVRDEQSSRNLGRIAQTATLCSCEMCRNPRRTAWKEPTLAERRFYAESIADMLVDQIDDEVDETEDYDLYCDWYEEYKAYENYMEPDYLDEPYHYYSHYDDDYDYDYYYYY